ncbi:ABC transporter permease [Blastococcus sp. SYSU D00820]
MTALQQAGTAQGPAPARPRSRRPRLTTTGIIWLAFAGIAVVGAVLVGLAGENLLAGTNVIDMLTRTSVLGFIAIGQTFVILCRSLDLSVGYVAALSSLVGATTMAGQEGRLVLGIGAALLVACAVGLVNGLVITKLKVNPFIATLGMALIIQGYLDTRYQGPAGAVPDSFQAFGYTRIGVVPLSTAVLLLLAVAAAVFLRRTRTGYAMFAVGGNDEVARLSGIRTDRTLVVAHVLSAALAGVAGLLLASRFSTGVGAQIYGAGYDLESIAAVVLGGTLLMGGRGGIAGTLAGVLILALLDTIFRILEIDPFVRDVLRGLVIIIAVAIYARRQIDRRGNLARFGPGGHPPEPAPGAAPTDRSAEVRP